MKKFRNYKIENSTAYASGQKMSYPSNSTIAALKKLGVKQIVWKNGDFLMI